MDGGVKTVGKRDEDKMARIKHSNKGGNKMEDEISWWDKSTTERRRKR